jgi:hypothetical protein
MTDKQIENWRKILAMDIGPYAYLMSKEEIEMWRDKLQGMINKQEFTQCYPQ